MKIIKRIVALFLCVTVICCLAVNATAETDTEEPTSEVTVLDGYTLITESEVLSLYVNTSNANIAVVDKRTNKVWTAFSDEHSSSDSRTSMLNVTYNGGTNISMQAGTHDSSIGFDVLKIKNGIKEIFYFETETLTFEIPFKVTLKDNYIEITILYKDIKEKGTGKISDIQLLPNWGAGDSTQDGYILIPDGSGAVIEYKDIVSRTDSYSGRVYGKDSSQDLIYAEITDSETVRMPVFGIRQGDSAIFSVITAGDMFATVNAQVKNNTATVNASFIYRESDLTGIQESDGGTRTMTILQSKAVSVEPVVRQYYLSGEEATYSGMANTYRSHLEDSGVLKSKTKKQTPAVAIEAFGAVSEGKSFLGIPFKQTLKVTTFEELRDLAEKLKESGIENVPFYLYGFLNGGYAGGTNVKPNYINKLGGKKGYKEFISEAGNGNVYTVYNITRSFGDSFEFFRVNQYMRSLNQTTVEQHYRILSSGTWDTEFGVWKYYTVEKQKKLFSKLLKNLPKDANIVFEHTGEELVSDFSNKNTVNRNEYLFFLNQMFKKCKDSKVSVAHESGNAYSAQYASEMYEIPLESSGFSIESYSVPFYTMVYHGFLPLSSKAVNDVPDSDAFKLKAFEQGISATWRVTGAGTYDIKETKLNFLYNSQIDNIYDTAVSMADDYNSTHSVLFDKCITEHKYENGLSITTYENGWQIVCNYGDETVLYNGTEVFPTDYAVFR